MYPITVFNDPASIADRETHEAQPGETLADWIIREYGPDGFDVPTVIYRGGISQHQQLDLEDFETVNRPVDAPVYVVHCPLGLDPFTIGIILAVAVIAAVAVAVLVPRPDVDSSLGGRQAKRSPNNALSSQSNIARTLDRAPDIFGQVVSYPDLIAPTVTEFIDHIKFQLEYLCVGRGYYDLVDFRSGETPIASIAGSTVVTYEPGSAPAEILKTRQSNEVAGQELLAPNDTAYTALTTADTAQWDMTPDTGTIVAPAGAWEGFAVSDTVVLANVNVNDGGTPYNLDGTYTVASAPTSTTLVLSAVSVVNANWSSLTDGLALNILSDPQEPHVTKTSAPQIRGPFVIPGSDDNSQVWIDITAPRGLAQGERLNKTRSVDLSFLLEEIDSSGTPTGGSFIYLVTVADDTRDPRFWTFKVTAADGLQLGTRYRASGQRLTDILDTDQTVVEEIRWSRLAGIEDISAPDTSGTTRVVIETRATEQVAALQDRKFNVKATRKTVTWDGSQVVGDIETGAGLTASRRFADAWLHYGLDPGLGALTLDRLDVEGVYAIQDRLDAGAYPEKGEFSGTFDDSNTPALEELRRIVSAARCFLYREGSIYSATRDEVQEVSRGLFNRRNKIPEAESSTVRFNRPLDTDGVELEYRDITDNNPRTITLPDDLPATDPLASLPAAVNPLKVEAVGIRQWAQAWDRAQYELRRQVYGRVSVKTTVTAEGLLLPLNARVQHVDGTRLTTDDSDGEVRGVDGLTITTSERCIFAGGGYSAVLRDDEGTPAVAIGVQPRSDTEFGFVLDSPPPFEIRTRDAGHQRGTLYSFGRDGNELAEAYLLQRKVPTDDNNVTLELINYAPEYYGADNDTPPDRPEV